MDISFATKIKMNCPFCESDRVAPANPDNPNSNVSCRQCGEIIGKLGAIEKAVNDHVLHELQHMRPYKYEVDADRLILMNTKWKTPEKKAWFRDLLRRAKFVD